VIPRGLLLARRRLLQAVPVLVFVVLGTFLLLEIAPGDAVDAYLAGAGGGGSADFAERLRAEWGLGGSLATRLVAYLAKLATFDLGWSVTFSRPVVAVIADRVVNTLLLMSAAIFFAVALGILLGALAALRPAGLRDTLLVAGSMVLNAAPGFWLGLMMIVIFSVKLGWFPSGGLMAVGGAPTMLDRIADIAWHLVLPVATLALTYLALYLRLMRAAMLEAGRSDYVRTALAKGLSRRRIVWRHMARNAVLPVATMVGLQASGLLGGSVVIETVFAIPGMGRLAYEAVTQRDLPLLMGVMLSSAVVVILVNLLLDLVYARLDPRIEA
jgi:peptide/nickel transport system permease protein